MSDLRTRSSDKRRGPSTRTAVIAAAGGALLLALGARPARAAEVRKDRPRMLVTRDGLEALRAKCRRGPGAAMFAAMKRRADGMLRTRAQLDNNGRHYLPTYATMYLLTGERRYADKAKRWLDLLSKTTIEDPWQCLEYIPVAAIAYDWIHPTLSEKERERFAGGMIRQVERIKKLWRHSDYNNHFLLEHMSELHVALALAHEPHHADVWRRYLAEGERWLKANVIPAMNEMAGDDGGCAEGFSYANWGVERPLSLYLLAWKSATGEDLFGECTFLRWAPRWNLYGRKPDGRQCRSEDCPSSHRWGQGAKSIFAIAAAAYRDRHAQWAHDRIDSKYPQVIWRHLVPWEASVRPEPPAKLPLATVFRPLGHVYTRSAWEAEDATWASFQCGPLFAGHQHLDNNSFVIHKRGALAIDSGVNEYSSHRASYYSRSVAHNTILVHDRLERFPKAVWSSQGTGGSNDGGGRRVNYPTRATATDREKAVREVGRILAFRNCAAYAYACGDATKSYSPAKLKGFTRQFVHLRPDTFVVFDRVVAASERYPKTWLLHSVNEPVILGKKDGPSFRVEHGGGRLDVWTLLPGGARVEAVGGPGREFWVDGKNYPPDKKTDPEAGAWRVEVRPAKPAAYDVFLHVLHASDARAPGALPEAKLAPSGGGSVAVEIVQGGRKATLRFRIAGRPGGHITITEGGREIAEEPLPERVLLPERRESWGIRPD